MSEFREIMILIAVVFICVCTIIGLMVMPVLIMILDEVVETRRLLKKLVERKVESLTPLFAGLKLSNHYD